MLTYKRLALALIFSITICVTFSNNLFAQNQASAPAARKIDEFGDIQLSDLKARLDAFVAELQNDPNSRGFIIVYRSYRDLPGLSSRLANRAKPYLIYSRGLPAERLVIVDGGAASCLTQELWIVPPGATPKPRDDAYPRYFTSTEVARKFDEYYFSSTDDPQSEDGGYEGEGNLLEPYAAALRLEPRAQAYIILYPQHSRQERRTDSPRATQRMLGEVKRELTRRHKISASRIRMVNGGYRRWREIELWIVPRGEHAPIATPNAFPRSRARR